MEAEVPIIDTHAHLSAPEYAGELEAVLERAHAAGVAAIVCVGYDLITSRGALALADRYPQVYAAVGVHPNYVAQAPVEWRELIAEMVAHPRVVAIGETGLDTYRKYTPSQEQVEAFRWHLALAESRGLPVVVHNRDASEAILQELTAWTAGGPGRGQGSRGVLHCFTGGQELIEALAELSFTVSFAGQVTFKNAEEVRRMAAAAPLDRLVVETDCPYLAPAPHRGRRNEPAYLPLTVAAIAELRCISQDALGNALVANTMRLFPKLRDVPRNDS